MQPRVVQILPEDLAGGVAGNAARLEPRRNARLTDSIGSDGADVSGDDPELVAIPAAVIDYVGMIIHRPRGRVPKLAKPPPLQGRSTDWG
jgi:hypothetical protein